MKTITAKVFCLFIGIFYLSIASDAQVLLQLEKYRVAKGEKFFPGQEITFKLRAFPDEWKREKIERILPSDSLIITENGMIHINDFIEFRTYNEKVKAASYMLQTFAAAWFLYGGIAWVAADFDFGTDTAIIGGTAFLSGWLLKKLFYKNTYKLGSKHRLRILDITWPEPEKRTRP